MSRLRGREARIAEIECIPVTLPIEAPILTSYGSLKSYARSIIRVRTENGLTGYGDVSARIGPTVNTYGTRGIAWSADFSPHASSMHLIALDCLPVDRNVRRP